MICVSAPIAAADLRIVGVNMTGTNAGYVYMTDPIICTGYSVPRPDSSSYKRTELISRKVYNVQTLFVGLAANVLLTCTASNIVAGVTYSATTNPLNVTSLGSSGPNC